MNKILFVATAIWFACFGAFLDHTYVHAAVTPAPTNTLVIYVTDAGGHAFTTPATWQSFGWNPTKTTWELQAHTDDILCNGFQK